MDKLKEINGITYEESRGRCNCTSDFISGTLYRDTTIKGITFEKHTLLVTDVKGEVMYGFLKDEVLIKGDYDSGINYRNNISFHANGKVNCTFVGGTGGVICGRKIGGYTSIGFHANGRIKFCSLKKKQYIDGLSCGGASYVTRFYDDGSIESSTSKEILGV